MLLLNVTDKKSAGEVNCVLFSTKTLTGRLMVLQATFRSSLFQESHQRGISHPSYIKAQMLQRRCCSFVKGVRWEKNLLRFGDVSFFTVEQKLGRVFCAMNFL